MPAVEVYARRIAALETRVRRRGGWWARLRARPCSLGAGGGRSASTFSAACQPAALIPCRRRPSDARDLSALRTPPGADRNAAAGRVHKRAAPAVQRLHGFVLGGSRARERRGRRRRGQDGSRTRLAAGGRVFPGGSASSPSRPSPAHSHPPPPAPPAPAPASLAAPSPAPRAHPGTAADLKAAGQATLTPCPFPPSLPRPSPHPPVLRRALIPAQQLIYKLQAKSGVAEGDDDESGRHSHFLSPLTRVYLNDVLDHVDTVGAGGWGVGVGGGLGELERVSQLVRCPKVPAALQRLRAARACPACAASLCAPPAPPSSAPACSQLVEDMETLAIQVRLPPPFGSAAPLAPPPPLLPGGGQQPPQRPGNAPWPQEASSNPCPLPLLPPSPAGQGAD
jgi:hypothetical protein